MSLIFSSSHVETPCLATSIIMHVALLVFSSLNVNLSIFHLIFTWINTKSYREHVKQNYIYFAHSVLTCFHCNNRETVPDSATSKHLLAASKVYPLGFFDSFPFTTCVR